MKPGETEKEGFALPQGAAFVALAEIQPARAPDARGRRASACAADLVEEAALEKARAAAGGGARQGREAGPREGGRGRSRSCARRPRRSPARGQALGDLGTGLALEEAAFSLPEKTLSEPVRAPLGLGGAARAREEALRRGRARAAEGAARGRASRQQRQSELFRAFLIAAQGPLPDRAQRRRPTAARSARSSSLREGSGNAMHVEVRQTKDV